MSNELENTITLEHHHVKYLELDGVDEIELITRSEHMKENWLSRKGIRPKIPKNILANAHNRLVRRLDFTQSAGQNVQLHEMVRIEPITGKVFYNSRFRLNKGSSDVTCLPVVDI